MKAGEMLMLDMTAKNPLADGIKKKVMNERLNYNILITGRTQKRKSTTGIAMARNIYPEWSFEKDFAILKTKDMIKTIISEGKRGSVKLLDEIGVGMDHHTWFTFFQKAMVYIVETGGFEGKIVIVTSPYSDIVNRDVLKFFNMHIKIVGKSERDKYSVVKVTTVEYNDDTQKIYKKYPRGVYPDGSVKVMKFFKIKFPTNDVMDKYFSIANPAKKGLQYDLIGEADKIEMEKVKKFFNPEFFVSEIMKDSSKFVVDFYGRKYVSREKIMNAFPVGDTRARRIKVMAEERLGINEERTGSSFA